MNCKKMGVAAYSPGAGRLARLGFLAEDPLVPSSKTGIGAALRLMRERRGIDRAQMEELGGPPKGTVEKVEVRRPPDMATLERYLFALGANFHDLAYALDEVNGRGGAPARPDAFFVDVIRRAGLDDNTLLVATLTGLIQGHRREDRGPKVLEKIVASAGEAARQMTLRLIAELEHEKPFPD